MKLSEESKCFSSFDELVECGAEEGAVAKAIMSQGFYGAPINGETIAAFERGDNYDPPQFSVASNACDGAGFEAFDSKDKLEKYLLERADGAYWDGETEFHTDYCRYSFTGTTMKDMGITRDDVFCAVLK